MMTNAVVFGLAYQTWYMCLRVAYVTEMSATKVSAYNLIYARTVNLLIIPVRAAQTLLCYLRTGKRHNLRISHPASAQDGIVRVTSAGFSTMFFTELVFMVIPDQPPSPQPQWMSLGGHTHADHSSTTAPCAYGHIVQTGPL